jgi:hypothetical protein
MHPPPHLSIYQYFDKLEEEREKRECKGASAERISAELCPDLRVLGIQ